MRVLSLNLTSSNNNNENNDQSLLIVYYNKYSKFLTGKRVNDGWRQN